MLIKIAYFVRKKLGWLIIILVIYFSFNYLNHKIRKASQHNEIVYNIIMGLDFVSFITNGGDSFGYTNYYKWHYAKWRKSPKRTLLEKVIFWNAGVLYDASNPPEEYQYPLL